MSSQVFSIQFRDFSHVPRFCSCFLFHRGRRQPQPRVQSQNKFASLEDTPGLCTSHPTPLHFSFDIFMLRGIILLRKFYASHSRSPFSLCVVCSLLSLRCLFSRDCALSCISRYWAQIRPFRIRHLRTPLHFFAPEQTVNLLESDSSALFAKNGGVPAHFRNVKIDLKSGMDAVRGTPDCFYLP
jgi:hypothetical protein